jgi:hypothetical protein
MGYLSGVEIYVGGNVTVDKCGGVVVCVLDTKQFTENIKKVSNIWRKVAWLKPKKWV